MPKCGPLVPVRGVFRTGCAAAVVAITTGTVAAQACRREPHSEIVRILRADNGFEVSCDELPRSDEPSPVWALNDRGRLVVGPTGWCVRERPVRGGVRARDP